MKKLTMLMIGVMAIAMFTPKVYGDWELWGDTDALDMPVYYYTSDTEVNTLPSTSQAQRTLYEYQLKSGTGAASSIVAGFNNSAYIDRPPLLMVELSDQDLYWLIFDYVPVDPIATRTVRHLAGSNRGNGTGITLRVFSTNNENGGAELRFSGAEDLVRQGPGDQPTLPTFYGFTGSATQVPASSTLISAPDLNNPDNLPNDLRYIPADTDWVRYIWSAIDIKDPERKGLYKDPGGLFIEVRNRPWE
ncbi:MAG: hypothetical protein AB1297_07905 [bacterium]